MPRRRVSRNDEVIADRVAPVGRALAVFSVPCLVEVRQSMRSSSSSIS
jgi:hypothetical protein